MQIKIVNLFEVSLFALIYLFNGIQHFMGD